MKEQIELGELVDVYFTSAQTLTRAKVLLTPKETGRDWVFWDTFWHNVVVVNSFERIDGPHHVKENINE